MPPSKRPVPLSRRFSRWYLPGSAAPLWQCVVWEHAPCWAACFPSFPAGALRETGESLAASSQFHRATVGQGPLEVQSVFLYRVEV